MPSINLLQISNFRNLSSIELKPSSNFNLICGHNGAGKTSILEAIYYLGRGKSFRTHLADPIIQRDTDSFTIFASFDGASASHPLGIERNRDGSRQIRLNHELLASIAPVIKQFPLQHIGTECHRFFFDGSKVRRQFLDWGVFHVEPCYLNLWKQYEHILKQRNSCLKQRRPIKEITLWDAEYCRLAYEIDLLRRKYLETYIPAALEVIKKVLPVENFTIQYETGWKKATDYEKALRENLQKDIILKRSELGSHRADIHIECEGENAEDYLSQGQLKCLSYALLISQGLLLKQMTSNLPIFLIDDLPSELDPKKRSLVFEILSSLETQIFITGIELSDFDFIKTSGAQEIPVFHVKHGQITHENCVS